MKRLIPAIIAILLLLCVCFACFIQNQQKGKAVFSIKDSKTNYTFKASFNSHITPKVTRYMDSCANILRKENANFRITTSEGSLLITADKQANSATAISLIKKMCQDIGDMLIQD